MNGLWDDGDVRDAAWFDNAGLYVERRFLDEATCERLQAEMDHAPVAEAMVAKPDIAANAGRAHPPFLRRHRRE
jgi:hypothetical protein